MKEIALNSFLLHAEIKSFEKQLQILEVLKIIPEVGSENEDSGSDDFSKIGDESPSILILLFFIKCFIQTFQRMRIIF